MSVRSVIVASVLALAAAAPVSRAQEDPPPREAPGERSTAPDAQLDEREREVMRRRIHAQLERIAEQEARLERALALLDEGQPVEEVRRSVLRDRLRDRGPGADGPRGRRGEPAPPRPDGDRALRFIERHRPEMAERLRELRERDPERFREELGRLMPRVEGLMERFDRFPEEMEARQRFHRIERRARDVAAQIAAAPPEEAAALTLELRRLVASGFETRLEMTREETRMLRERLDGLTERLEDFEANRQRLIDEQVQRMIEEAAADRGRSAGPEGDGPE